MVRFGKLDDGTWSAGEVLFEEDKEGFPTCIRIQFPFLNVLVEIKSKDLPLLIPFINSVKSNLKLLPSSEEKITSVIFDVREETFYLEHAALKLEAPRQIKQIAGEWIYLSSVGFYPVLGEPMLHRSHLSGEEAVPFGKDMSARFAPFIPVHEQRISLSYSMFFDEKWNWHFTAYLFSRKGI